MASAGSSTNRSRIRARAADYACSSGAASFRATGGGAENGAAGTLALAGAILACADAVGRTASRDGSAPPSLVNASDGLFVLRASVGSECCDLCICDANGSGDVSATDALITLSVAVGQTIPLQCPVCP